MLSLGKKPSRRKYKPDSSFLKSIDNLKSPWKNFDKFEHFKRTLEIMKKNNEHVFSILMEQLSEDTRASLNEIFSISIISNRVRKVIKVRRDVFREEVFMEEPLDVMIGENRRRE